jgi:hypothetical protein
MFNKACYAGGAAAMAIAMTGIATSPTKTASPHAFEEDNKHFIERLMPSSSSFSGDSNNSLPPSPDQNSTNGGNYTGDGGALSQDINGRIGESTYNVPGTQNGNVACAYVVNSVYQQATGETIVGPGGNNLSVYDTMQAMDANPSKFTQVDRATAIASGQDYIIASNYNYGSNGSHIGIGNGNTVWSNSSSSASIRQNYTADSWGNHFGATKYYIVNK